MSRMEPIPEGPFKQLFILDDQHCLLQFKEIEPVGVVSKVLFNAARACNIVSAYLFDRLKDPLTWTHIAISPALQSFRSDWLARRWDHLVYSHILSEHGAPTHFVDLVSFEGFHLDYHDAAHLPSFLKVLKIHSSKAEKRNIDKRTVYFYPPVTDTKATRVLPVKVRYHLKLAAGSQLAQRLEDSPGDASLLGLQAIPAEEAYFERPVLEFYTRDEEPERLLNVQEALLISGLTPGQFEEMVEFSYCCALAIHALLQERSLEVFDGFLEYAATSNGIMLIDTLSPLDMTIAKASEPVVHQVTCEKNPEQSNALWGGLCNQILGDTIFADCPARI